MLLFPVRDGTSILVVGDLMLDGLVRVKTKPATHEAQLVSICEDGNEPIYSLGASGNVAMSVNNLGFRVNLMTCGDLSQEVSEAVKSVSNQHARFFCSRLFEGKQVSKRTRYMADGRIVARFDDDVQVDYENAIAIANAVEGFTAVSAPSAVILSDYGKGAVTNNLAQWLVAECGRREIPIVVDAKTAHFRIGASFVKVNEKEFWEDCQSKPINRISDKSLVDAAKIYMELRRIGSMALTLGHRGVLAMNSHSARFFPAYGDGEASVAGTGDVFTATLATQLAMKVGFFDAVEAANFVAGVAADSAGVVKTASGLSALIRQSAHDFRNKVVVPDEPGGDLLLIQHLRRIIKAAGDRIVFTNGCFDLFHAGHVDSLHQMAGGGDIVVVSVAEDELVRKLKGGNQPIVSLDNRIAMLAACQDVDIVVTHKSDDHLAAIIDHLKPDEIVKGDDWAGKEVVGGTFRTVPRRINLSTSAIIEKIRS